MAAGERLSSGDRLSLDRAIRRAEELSRFEFSVFVGPMEGEDPRSFAERLHGALVAPGRSVLLAVDPQRRTTEIVTGKEVRRRITDAAVDLAVLDMQGDFAAGRITSGLVRGIDKLAAHARP